MPPRRRGIRFKARDLERWRKYMWREDFIPILQNRLEIRPGQTIVDVGCGTGFFTRMLAKVLGGEGRAIGIDRNERLIEVARRLAKDEKLGEAASFHKGNAESIPLVDGAADRVVCQTLLWTLKDPRPTIHEMVRVCKPGGLVGAVEGAFDYVVWYVPDDARLTKLNQKRVTAFSKGHAKLYGSDRGIGYKLPAMFSEAGLKRIRLDGFPYVWLESDDRVPRSFRLQEHRQAVYDHEHPKGKGREENERILKLGGMTGREVDEMRRKFYQRSKRIMRNPEFLNEDFSMNGGLFLLTTGIKT